MLSRRPVVLAQISPGPSCGPASPASWKFRSVFYLMTSPVSCLTGTPEAYLAIIVNVACSSAPSGSALRTPTKYSGAIAICLLCLPDKRARSCTSVHFPTLAKMKPRSPRVSHDLLSKPASRYCSTENKAQNIKTLKTLSE